MKQVSLFFLCCLFVLFSMSQPAFYSFATEVMSPSSIDEIVNETMGVSKIDEELSNVTTNTTVIKDDAFERIVITESSGTDVILKTTFNKVTGEVTMEEIPKNQFSTQDQGHTSTIYQNNIYDEKDRIKHFSHVLVKISILTAIPTISYFPFL